MRTREEIVGLIGLILHQISRREEIKLDLEEMKIEHDSHLAKAIAGQEKIGWQAMCQGYLHKEWASSQRDHYKRQGLNSRYHNTKRWTKMLGVILIDYSLDCWERRNHCIHGNSNEDRRNKKLQRLRKQVERIYRMKKELKGTKFASIFSLAKEKRKNMGVHSTKIWIDMAEESLRLHRENATKNTIHQWLQH